MKQERKQQLQKGICPKCSGRIIETKLKESKRQKKILRAIQNNSYYFERVWKCLKCRAIFNDEDSVVFPKQDKEIKQLDEQLYFALSVDN